MKKTTAVVLALLMVLSGLTMTGCSDKDKGISFKAGTYQAESQGIGGMVPVTVEFSDSEILSITVGENHETKGISDPALTRIPADIVKGQTLNVDSVSGASVSSNAVITAVIACIEQAGGDVEALKARPAVVQTAGEDIEKSADVIIIGAGGAGLAAALSAGTNGSTVIVIEKGASIGGNTIRSGGGYNAVDPVRQAAIDMDPSQVTELKSILDVDPASIDADFSGTLEDLQGQIREYLKGDTSVLFDTVELHTYQSYKSGKRIGLDGTEIHGTYELLSTVTSRSLDTLEWVASYDDETDIRDEVSTVLGGLWPRMHSLTTSVGHGFISPLEKSATKFGAEIMLETKAVELVMTDGKVTGVIAEKPDGTKVILTANKGVVMTTGGYGANPKMAMEYDNYWNCLTPDMPTTNTALATGDGIIMGKAVGADLVGMGYIQLMPSSHPVTGSLGGGVWGSADDQVFVNKEGKRFVSEYESRDVLSKAALEQTDGMFWIIGDQISSGDPQLGGQNYWGNSIDELLKDKSIYMADTLEDLAVQFGADPEILVAEIEKYNSFCDNGVDEDFGKVRLGKKIEDGPFWATPRKPSIHHTMGGLKIDSDARVLDADGNPIPGFYAAGEVTGGIHAGNRVGGNAIPDIMVFGRIAGSSAAAEL